MKKTVILACILGFVFSCNKDNFNGRLGEDEYFVFGTTYSECNGNCVRLYKIENKQLFEDNVEQGHSADPLFQTDPLSNDKYKLAKELWKEFPDKLLQSEERKYGCPDCYDQGSIVVQLEFNDTIEKWGFSTNSDDLEGVVREYQIVIKSVLDELSQ